MIDMTTTDITLKRYWDDLRTSCDMLGELIGKGSSGASIRDVGDRVDDIAGRIILLGDRTRGLELCRDNEQV